MPARGDGLAMLKWISSFPGNPERGLPTVMGVVVLSDAETSEPLALLDARSVTALRTGAVAAVAARALARRARERPCGIVGCGLHGAWAARCLVGGGLRRRASATTRARRWPRRWRPSSATAGAPGRSPTRSRCDVVTCVTPGAAPVVDVGDLRPGLHLNMLGADGPGKAEATIEAVAACELYCDEWAQAVARRRADGRGRGRARRRARTSSTSARCSPARRRGPPASAPTLFDSTGLAIQDLAIAAAVVGAARARYVGGTDAAPPRYTRTSVGGCCVQRATSRLEHHPTDDALTPPPLRRTARVASPRRQQRPDWRAVRPTSPRQAARRSSP